MTKSFSILFSKTRASIGLFAVSRLLAITYGRVFYYRSFSLCLQKRTIPTLWGFASSFKHIDQDLLVLPSDSADSVRAIQTQIEQRLTSQGSIVRSVTAQLDERASSNADWS